MLRRVQSRLLARTTHVRLPSARHGVASRAPNRASLRIPILSLTIVTAVAGEVGAHWRVLWGALRLGKTPVNSIPRDWIDERAVAYHGADTRADQDRRELHQMTLCAASGMAGRGRRWIKGRTDRNRERCKKSYSSFQDGHHHRLRPTGSFTFFCDNQQPCPPCLIVSR